MWGGDFAGGTLQVLLEAQVEGLADRADYVLGQAIRALQYVTRYGVGAGGSKWHTVMSRLQLKCSKRLTDDSTGRENTSSVYRVLCYVGNVICCILEHIEEDTVGEKQTP